MIVLMVRKALENTSAAGAMYKHIMRQNESSFRLSPIHQTRLAYPVRLSPSTGPALFEASEPAAVSVKGAPPSSYNDQPVVGH